MKLIRIALAAALVFAFIRPSDASLLYDINNTGEGQAFSGFAGNWGFEFLASQTETVNALGVWDEGSAALPSSIQVGLWNASVGGEVTSATVTNSSIVVPSTASNVGQWLFTDLSHPVTLLAGTDYFLGFLNDNPAGNTGTGLIPFRGNTTATFVSGTSYVASEANANARMSLIPPNGAQGGTDDAWFGPNFDTTLVGVPEPASLLLAALGVLGLAGFSLRRRRHA